MKHLTKNDLKAWVAAVTHPLASADSLIAWLEGPLRKFFPFKGVVLGHGELVAGHPGVAPLQRACCVLWHLRFPAAGSSRRRC